MTVDIDEILEHSGEMIYSVSVLRLETKKANKIWAHVSAFLIDNGYDVDFNPFCSETTENEQPSIRFSFKFHESIDPELKEIIRTALIQAIAIWR